MMEMKMLRVSDFGTSQSIGRDNCAIVEALKSCIRSERQNIRQEHVHFHTLRMA